MEDQTSRFLDLPPELRNTIYEYVFAGSITTTTSPIISTPRYWLFKHKPASGPDRFGLPGILAANKQIRGEASTIFTATTKWTARLYDHTVVPLIKKLGHRRMKLAQNVWCSFQADHAEGQEARESKDIDYTLFVDICCEDVIEELWGAGMDVLDWEVVVEVLDVDGKQLCAKSTIPRA